MKTPFVVTAAIAAALACGCASKGYEQSQSTSQAMEGAVTSLEKYATARGSAFEALNALAAEPLENLPARFEAFEAAVDGVVAADGSLRSSVDGMKSSGDARFKSWAEQNATISDEGIRTRAQQRMGESEETFKKGVTDADAMLEHSKSFVSYISDIRKLLSNDLTPAGITSCADLFQNARASNGKLHQLAQPTLTSVQAAADALATK